MTTVMCLRTLSGDVRQLSMTARMYDDVSEVQ